MARLSNQGINRNQPLLSGRLPDGARVVAERAGVAAVRPPAYDSAGRKQSVNVTPPRPATGVTGAAPTVAMAFTYDASGNRTGATWSGGTVSWTHDGLNRIGQVSFGAEMVTAHAWKDGTLNMVPCWH